MNEGTYFAVASKRDVFLDHLEKRSARIKSKGLQNTWKRSKFEHKSKHSKVGPTKANNKLIEKKIQSQELGSPVKITEFQKLPKEGVLESLRHLKMPNVVRKPNSTKLVPERMNSVNYVKEYQSILRKQCEEMGVNHPDISLSKDADSGEDYPYSCNSMYHIKIIMQKE